MTSDKYTSYFGFTQAEAGEALKEQGENPEPERFCQGFVPGVMEELKDSCIISSNRGSGFGRYDVVMETRDNLKIGSRQEHVSMKKKQEVVYEIMHMEKCVASITSGGKTLILDGQFMPYDLYLEEEDDLDTRINNLIVFHHWCASRLLSLDRKYAKELFTFGRIEESKKRSF